MRARQPALLLVAFSLVWVCACSRDSGSGVGNRSLDTALAGSAPACSLTWVEGKRLPPDYRGCVENGTLQGAASRYDCLDGGTIALFSERFYARLGGRIRVVEGEISEDPAYARFWHNCVG